jgi:MarR-like DNA-binding transcriptional regulator SgrR of sgrS sRNA
MTTCSKLTTLAATLAAAAFMLAPAAPAQAHPVCTGPYGPCRAQVNVAACHYERLHYPNKWVCTWPSVNR